MGIQHNIPVERQVLELFLRDPRQSRPGLHVALEDIDPRVVNGALVALLVKGLLIRDGAQTWLLALCVTHLDTLGMLATAAPNGSPSRAPDAATMDRILAASRQRDDREWS